MAIFGEIGKKFSESSQSVIKKTKEFTEISKINLLINEKNKKLRDVYCQIGKRYTEVHSSDFEEQFKDLVSLAIMFEIEIKDLSRQISKINGVVLCDTCGAEVPAFSSYCNKCGKKINLNSIQNDLMSNSIVKCQKCGEPIDIDARFCPSCGTLVNLPSNNINEQNSTIRINVKKCLKCGAVYENDDIFFCEDCGTPLSRN